MSEFWMEAHSSIVLPFSHSVAYDELAIAEPHPNVCERGEHAVRCGGVVRFAGGVRVRVATAGREGERVLTLNTAFSTLPSLMLICSFMTSPHAGAPTRPVPTLGSFLSSEPTLRGDS